ncbi:MAG: response regulator [Bacteroidetes bacterium]|nr:MAG: response regulator [Bacteroidota bacterium]
MKKSNEILIIDDDPVFGMTFKKYLENKGFGKVMHMGSVVESIYTLDLRPDILFVDYNLDDITGIDAIKIYRKKWPNALILLISGSESIRKFNDFNKHKIEGLIVKSEGFERMVRYAESKYTLRIVKKLLLYGFLPVSVVLLLYWLYS